jgi:hypothetical protein
MRPSMPPSSGASMSTPYVVAMTSVDPEEILYGDLGGGLPPQPPLNPPLFEPEGRAAAAGIDAVVVNEVGRRYNLQVVELHGKPNLMIFDAHSLPEVCGGDRGALFVFYEVDVFTGSDFLEPGFGLELGDEETKYLEAAAVEAVVAWLREFVRKPAR